METDERGIPINYGDGVAAPQCPPRPCELCTGTSSIVDPDTHRVQTSWEWCQSMKTCAATVDWEQIYHGS
jgi:hypothetical protein